MTPIGSDSDHPTGAAPTVAGPLLALSEGRAAWILDQAPVMIWVARADGVSVYFNRRLLDFTGRTLAEELALGGAWVEGVHPEDRERCLRGYREALEARRGFVIEYRLRRADGEYRTIQDWGAPWRAAAEGVEGFIGCCIDITDATRAQERLIEEQAALARRAQGQLLAVVAHELSQPLMAIMNYLEGARRSFAALARDEPLFGEFLDECERLTRRTSELVRRLREHAASLRPSPVDGRHE